MAMTNGTSKGCDCAFSRGAATECSPGRKRGVGVVLAHQPRRGERVFRPYGAEIVSKENPGLTPGATLCRRSAAVHGGAFWPALTDRRYVPYPEDFFPSRFTDHRM